MSRKSHRRRRWKPQNKGRVIFLHPHWSDDGLSIGTLMAVAEWRE